MRAKVIATSLIILLVVAFTLIALLITRPQSNVSVTDAAAQTVTKSNKSVDLSSSLTSLDETLSDTTALPEIDSEAEFGL